MEWQWHQLDHMQIICTSLQTVNHASTPSLSFLQAGCLSCRPTNSVKALKAHHIQYVNLTGTARSQTCMLVIARPTCYHYTATLTMSLYWCTVCNTWKLWFIGCITYRHSTALRRTTCVSRHPQLRTGGFGWSKVSLSACLCWWHLAHYDVRCIRKMYSWIKIQCDNSSVLPLVSLCLRATAGTWNNTRCVFVCLQMSQPSRWVDLRLLHSSRPRLDKRPTSE